MKKFTFSVNYSFKMLVSFLHRWGNTPMDEAIHFGHHDVVTILQDYHNTYSPKETTSNVEKETAEKNLDGML